MKPYSRFVNYYETDKMAVVHHSNYIRIMEEARIDFMSQAGIPHAAIDDQGVFIPVVDVYTKFHTSLCYGDQFYVKVKLLEFNGIRMLFSYEIRRSNDDELCASGKSSHCFIDAVTKRPVNLRKRLPKEAELIAALL